MGRGAERHAEQFRDRYEAGASLNAIGSEFGFTSHTVRTHLDRLGVNIREKHRHRRLDACRRCGVAAVHDGGKCKPCLTLYQRERHLFRKYGITVEQYEQRLVEQEGRCAICKCGPDPRRHFAVDHCHDTGRVRGLLCFKCNYYLGHWEGRARALVEYLGE